MTSRVPPQTFCAHQHQLPFLFSLCVSKPHCAVGGRRMVAPQSFGTHPRLLQSKTNNMPAIHTDLPSFLPFHTLTPPSPAQPRIALPHATYLTADMQHTHTHRDMAFINYSWLCDLACGDVNCNSWNSLSTSSFSSLSSSSSLSSAQPPSSPFVLFSVVAREF